MVEKLKVKNVAVIGKGELNHDTTTCYRSSKGGEREIHSTFSCDEKGSAAASCSGARCCPYRSETDPRRARVSRAYLVLRIIASGECRCQFSVRQQYGRSALRVVVPH